MHRLTIVRVGAVFCLGVFGGYGCGGSSSPPEPGTPERFRIVALSPSTFDLGPAETGKRARDRIVLVVRDNLAVPVAGAVWRWTADDRSGWVYPAEGVTAQDGRISATWVPGLPGDGALILTVSRDASSLTTRYRTESVSPPRPPAGAVGVWMNHAGRADGYSVDITPLTEPGGTYYAALRWDGGYAGLQRAGSRYDRQLQFSVWDIPGKGDARVIESGDGVDCRRFGSEGTGQACELNYPWAVGETYRFEVTEEPLNGGSAFSLHVTDLAISERRFVGTLRYAATANLHFFETFVEDFWHDAAHCLAQAVRGAAIRRAMARIDGAWQPLQRGIVNRHEKDTANPGTPPCANLAVREHNAGLEIIMGGRTSSDPDAPPEVLIPE